MDNPEKLETLDTQDTRGRQTQQKQHITMCWTSLYVNRYQCLLQSTGGKDEPNIDFIWKLQRTSQHGTQNAKTFDRTTQKTNMKTTRTQPKKPGLLAMGKQFLLLIRHPPCCTRCENRNFKHFIFLIKHVNAEALHCLLRR